MARGTIEAKLNLSTAGYRAGLAQALKDAQAFKTALSSSVKITLPAPQIGGFKAASAALREQNDLVRKARDDVSNLRVAYERGDISRADFIRDTQTLDREIIQLRDSLKDMPTAVAGLNRALGTNARGLQTAQGQVSRLGLSQQVLIGTNRELAQSLLGSGRLGSAASVGLTAYGGGLATASTGALLLGGAVLAVGASTAALAQRGVPQVKSFQASINVLAESGEKNLGRLDQTLSDLQKEAGRAGRSFSRSELAAALAETTKAGVSTDDALTILRQSVKLAAAENTNLSGTTALVLKGLRQYQLGVEDAGKVTDQLAQGGLLAAGTAEDIGVGLSRVAGTGRAAGVELSDLIGLIIELDNAGLDARDRGASALNSALSALAALTPKAKTQLADWNIEVNNTDGSARRAGDILKDLGDKLRASGVQYDESTDSLTGNGDALRGLANIMGTEGARAVLNLTGKWREYAAEVKNSEGVSQSYADTMTRGVEPAQRRAQKALDDLSKTVAQVFAPAIAGGADKVAGLIRKLDALTQRGGDAGVELVTLGSDFRRLFGGEEIKLLEGDLERVRGQVASLKEENARLDSGKFFGLPVPGILRANNDALIEENNKLIAQLETQSNEVQSQLDVIQGRKTKGAKKKPKPDPAPCPPPPAVDPAVQAEYEKALKAAQNRAAQAELATIQDNRARIVAARELDLQAAKDAFDESVAELEKGSKRYNQLQKLYNREKNAIEQQASQDLSVDAERKLETQKSLNERLAALQQQLVSEQNALSDNPLDGIKAAFDRSSSEILKSVQTLANEVQKAYRDGTIDKKTYLAELDEIGRTGNARLLVAEETYTKDTKAELQKRRDSVKELIDAQAKTLAETQIAGMEDGFEKERAQAKLEREERLKQYAVQLADFKGTLAERKKLLLQQNATEVALAQNSVASAQAKLTTAQNNLKAAYDAGIKAIKEYNEQVKQKNEEALRQTLSNQKAVLDARAGAAQQQFDTAEGPDEQTKAYERLLGVQREAVTLAAQYSRFERQRGANAQEITTALNNEASAQRDVVSVIGQQIDRLKELRDAQLDTLKSGSSAIELFRETQKLTGQKADTGQIQSALQAQLDAQTQLYQQQINTNASLDEQLATLKAINATRAEGANEGLDLNVSGAAVQSFNDNSTKTLNEAPGKIRDAANEFVSLDNQIRTLGETLETATSKLVDLLEQAGSGKGLELKVTPVYDDTALKEAGKAINAAIDQARAAEMEYLAAQEEARKTKREETERTATKVAKAQQQLGKVQGDLANAGRQIVDTATTAGGKAGAGLISAFARGVAINQSGLLSEVDRLLVKVRARLPSSDAKIGPLSDLTYSGGKLVTTFSAGMLGKRSSLASTANLIAASAKPAFAVPSIPTSRPASYAGAAGGAGGVANHYQIQVDGRPGQVTGLLGMSAKQLARDVQRELERRG